MKKLLIALLTVSLTLYPFGSKGYAETMLSDELTNFETSLEKKLESAGILNADVSIMLPMEKQSDNLDKETEELYNKEISPILDKPFDKVTDNDLQEVKKETKELAVDELAIETLEEHIITATEIKEDEKMVNNIKRELSVDNEDIVDTNDIIVEVTATNDLEEEFTSTIGFSIGDNVVDVITNTENENENEYELELLNISSEQINAVLTDTETEESIPLNDTEAKTSGVWIPVLGVFATLSMLELLAISVGVTVLLALAAKGLINLVSGALWVAGKVANENSKNKKYVHYEAKRSNDSKGLWVGPGKVKSKAVQRIKNGLDCWSVGSTNAKQLATGASPTGRYHDDPAHKPKTNWSGKRTFKHYHPYEKNGSHSFYGGGVLW